MYESPFRKLLQKNVHNHSSYDETDIVSNNAIPFKCYNIPSANGKKAVKFDLAGPVTYRSPSSSSMHCNFSWKQLYCITARKKSCRISAHS